MKVMEEIKHYRKEYVYEQYTRIVKKFKAYEKISKPKMLTEIYQVYSDYNNIIELCTVKELKYLQMILDNKLPKEYLSYPYKSETEKRGKYEWERRILTHKFLINCHGKEICIPEEVIENVQLAIKNVNWQEKQKSDDLNEILVSYCKIQGTAILDAVASLASAITGIKEEIIFRYMLRNKMFNYYVFITEKDFDTIGKDIPYAIYQDFYNIEEMLDEARKHQGLAADLKVDLRDYKTLFYNDFNINNPKIKKFLQALEELPFFSFSALQPIREYAMLNIDRTSLKELLKNVPALKNIDLTNFFKIMDEAMDEMPSGALNGFTPNEAKEIKLRNIKKEQQKNQRYRKQINACLSRKDAKLFYKIYFALLEFTNNKYKINPNIKIYNKNGINPYLIKDMVDKFWENKESLVIEFCIANPYKFNKEELDITKEFKNGIRNMFIINKFELEYTAFMTQDKVYMVKGINDNIDNIISYKDLPYICITSIIPFKNVLVYDGMFNSFEINLGNAFEEILDSEYDNLIKYYHL